MKTWIKVSAVIAIVALNAKVTFANGLSEALVNKIVLQTEKEVPTVMINEEIVATEAASSDFTYLALPKTLITFDRSIERDEFKMTISLSEANPEEKAERLQIIYEAREKHVPSLQLSYLRNSNFVTGYFDPSFDPRSYQAFVAEIVNKIEALDKF
jgi:hypothetical protein